MNKDDSSSRPSFFDKIFSYLDNRKPSDRLLLYIFTLVGLVAIGYTLLSVNNSHLSIVPQSGGVLNEGIVGTPRFVNPVLAITRADSDLTALIYSGLMKLGKDGHLENDLAESVTVSDDGLTYNIILRDNIRFHDDTPVTTEDVAYTIGLIQNPDLKSPLRGNWNGVNVEVISEREVNLVLDTPYTPFLENLTVGILPKHVWGQLSIEELPFSQNNTEPIGSGPYRLESVQRNKSGLIDSYYLSASPYHNSSPNITEIRVFFYTNETMLLTALQNGTITSTASIIDSSLKKVNLNLYQIVANPLPRVFTVFFNQNKSTVLRDLSARQALNTVIDRQDLVDTILDGYGLPTDTPIPSGFLDVISASSSSTTLSERQTEAEAILKSGSWTKTDDGHWQKDIDGTVTTLSLTLATANTNVFGATAEYLEKVWGDLGVEVTVEKFEQTDLVQAVIRPRDFEALLFGIDVGRPLDLYPFWHSSQREDPGLNISSYTSITADDLLEKIRTETDNEAKATELQDLVTEIDSDQPAIFLYTPSFPYIIDKQVMLVPVTHITKPSERFSTITEWYMNEDKVWSIFKD